MTVAIRSLGYECTGAVPVSLCTPSTAARRAKKLAGRNDRGTLKPLRELE